ncbi:MAG: ABC transporter substrate-binding protein [Acidimicrobiales bacterium]
MDGFEGRRFTDAVSRRRFLQLLGLGSAGAALAACGSSSSSPTTSKGGGSSTPTSSVPGFPLGAASRASGVVSITMWHAMTNANLTTLQNLAHTFNTSQPKIKVNLLGQESYTDTFTAYRAGLGSSNLPDLVQMESILLQDMVDSQSVVPAASALKADTSFDSSDVLPSAMAFFTVDGVQYGMPWNCSSQVMYFNKKVFQTAGLDPSTPPATLAEYKTMAAQAKSKGGVAYGTALKLTASNVEDWIAQTGGLLFNNGNGRSGRATAVEFGDATGLKMFAFYEEMLSSKIAEATLNTSYDNLIAIGNGSTAMSIDTSAALGTVLVLLRAGKYPSVDLGVGPLPGLNGPGDGVPYGGAGLYIVKHSVPEKQDAAWQFIKYLLTPPAMAAWSIGSGYIPITKSSVETAAIKNAWATTPQYKVAYEQVATSQANAATAGGVTGVFSEVETDIQNALSQISNGTSSATAVASAVSASNQALANYNSSI